MRRGSRGAIRARAARCCASPSGNAAAARMMARLNLVSARHPGACARWRSSRRSTKRASSIVELAEGAGACQAARSGVGTAAARAEHLGHARTRGENRQRPADDARAAGFAPASGQRREPPSEARIAAPDCRAEAAAAGGRASLLVLLLAGFSVLSDARVYLQGLNNDFLQEKGECALRPRDRALATRGMITDRNGEPLAISTPVESVSASPADVDISPPQMKRLSQAARDRRGRD